MRRRMLCSMLLILFSVCVTAAADETTDVDEFRLKTEGFPIPITIGDDPESRSITSVELAGSLKSGQGTITLNVGKVAFNDFGDAIPQTEEVAKPVAVQFERVILLKQPFGVDFVETRQLYKIKFEESEYYDRMFLVISTRTCDPHRLIINAPEPSKWRQRPPPQIFDLLGTPQVLTTLPDPGQPHFQWACLYREDDGFRRFDISGKPNGLAKLNLDPNHLGFTPLGDIAFSTAMGYSSMRSVIARQETKDPTEAGRVIYHIAPKQGNLKKHFALVLAPTADGPHRLIIRSNGQIQQVVPLHDPARRRFSKLYLQCAETSPTERSAIDELIRQIGYSFSAKVESNQITQLRIGSAMDFGDLDTVIARLPNLKELSLDEGTLTASGLPSLQALTQLEVLRFTRVTIVDAGLKTLTPLTSLRSLNFYSCTGLTDAGMPHLGQLKNLKSLQLYRERQRQDEPATPSITDAGLIHLTGLTKLQDLEVYGNTLTDTGLEHLKGLTQIRHLSISGDGITNTGLQHLQALKNLTRLNITSPQVTSEGLTELTSALPGLLD